MHLCRHLRWGPRACCGNSDRPGKPCGLARRFGENASVRWGRRWRLAKAQHGEKSVCADYAGVSVCVFYPFYGTPTTVTAIVVKSWYKTRSEFKTRGFGVDRTVSSPWSIQGENSGAPNWWYRLEGRRERLGSREDLNRRSDAMDDRHLAGSSETAGRNRHPRFTVS